MHVRWTMWMVGVVAACSASDAGPAKRPQAAQEKLPFAPSCTASAKPGFETPELAYAAYAAAFNEKDYCSAAGTYAPEQRAELATNTFMALLLTAGTTDKPTQPAYREQFYKLCSKYELGCGTEPRLLELVGALRAGKTLVALEPKFERVAKQAPEDVFRDVMSTLADVDPGAIGQLSPKLQQLTVNGERATALAERAGQRGTAVFLSKGSQGWALALH